MKHIQLTSAQTLASFSAICYTSWAHVSMTNTFFFGAMQQMEGGTNQGWWQFWDSTWLATKCKLCFLTQVMKGGVSVEALMYRHITGKLGLQTSGLGPPKWASIYIWQWYFHLWKRVDFHMTCNIYLTQSDLWPPDRHCSHTLFSILASYSHPHYTQLLLSYDLVSNAAPHFSCQHHPCLIAKNTISQCQCQWVPPWKAIVPCCTQYTWTPHKSGPYFSWKDLTI